MATTIKLSEATRDRIRAMKGSTYEETIVEALDALDVRRFWAEAEAYSKWRQDLPAAEREALAQEEADIDAAFDGIA